MVNPEKLPPPDWIPSLVGFLKCARGRNQWLFFVVDISFQVYFDTVLRSRELAYRESALPTSKHLPPYFSPCKRFGQNTLGIIFESKCTRLVVETDRPPC